MSKNKILLAGETWDLGKFITQELIVRDYETTIIVRDKDKIKKNMHRF